MPKSASQGALKKREVEILQLTSQGMTRNEIAVALMLSVETIAWYGRQIFKKLEAENWEEALARAVELGVIDAPTAPKPADIGAPTAPAEEAPAAKIVVQLATPPDQKPEADASPESSSETPIVILPGVMGIFAPPPLLAEPNQPAEISLIEQEASGPLHPATTFESTGPLPTFDDEMGLTDSTVIAPATHALSDEFDLAKAVAPAGQPVQPQPAQWDAEILSALAGSSTYPHDVDIDDEDWNLKGLSASSSDLMRFDVYVDDTGVFSPTEAVPDWELLAPKTPTEVGLAPNEPIGEEEADANLIEGDQEIKSDEPNLLEAQPDDEMPPNKEPVQTRSEVIGEIITPREIQGLVEHRQALPERKLPLPSGAFIGREREMRELRQLLADHQVVHLTGFAGVGKTRLALETANQLRSEFAGGVHYFYLPCVAQTALYSAVALHLMANPAAPPTGKALLILDHADQTSRPSSIIAEILSARPELQIIVTSRDWMGISSAAELKVLPLEIPHIHPRKAPNWSSLLESAAMRLFIRATEQALPGYSLRESDAAGLGHLCGRSQGLPILIEILAAHLRVYPPPIILMQLDNRLRGLGAGQPAPSLQQSLNGVLGWSHNLLKRDEQLALAGLSLFVGGWNEESAAAVLGPLTHSPIGEILDQLAQKHFVQVVSTDGDNKRYTMSDAVRDFAATKLRQHELYLEILRAFAGAFWRMIENFKTDQKQWLAPVEAEIDNIRTVLHLAAEHRAAEPLAQMTLGLWPLWEATERYDEADYWLSLALAQAE